MKRNLTNGSVFKNIVFFSLPYMLSYFLQTLYSMADMYIVSRFNGTASITAVSIGGQVMHMLTVMIMGLAVGGTVLLGQAVGAEDNAKAAKTVGNIFSIFLPLSLVLTAVLLLSADGVVAVMSTPVEAAEETLRYITVCFAGIPFITAYNLISAVLRGMGDSKSPMWFVLAACLCNILLDLVFVGGMGLGAAGAAMGTVLSQTVSVIIALISIKIRGLGLDITPSDFLPSLPLFRSVFRIGVPVCAQDGFIQIAFIVVTVIANRRGLNDAAAVGIVEKFIGVLFIIPSTMLSSVSALAAQNIGAGKPERAKHTLRCAVAVCVLFGAIAAGVSIIFAEEIVALFDGSPAVTALGAGYLRGYVFDCLLAGIHFCFSGYFCAVGKSWLSFLHNFLSIVLMRVPGAYFASVMFADTLFPMGLATTLGSLLSVMVCLTAYFIMNRREENARIY